MKPKKILLNFLALCGVLIVILYFYKNIIDRRVADAGITRYVEIKREAKNDQEIGLFLQAEKIKCVEPDKECFDLTNIDRDIIEAQIFNAKNDNLWHFYNKSIIRYTTSIKTISELYDELRGYDNDGYFDSKLESIDLQVCLEVVGKDGYRIIQNYNKFQGTLVPSIITTHQRLLFFTNENEYVCGRQSYQDTIGF